MKRLSISVYTLVCFLSLWTDSPATAQKAIAQGQTEQSAFRLGYSSMAGAFGAFWVAEEKGYFKENGLDVKSTYVNTTAGMQALVAGKFDAFGAGCSEVFEAIRRGFKIKAVAGLFDRNPYLIVAQKSITTPSMLVGKPVAVGRIGDNTHLITRYALRKLGVNPDSVTYVQIGSGVERFAALSAGTAVASVQSGFQRELAQKSGFNILIDFDRPDEPGCPGAIAVGEDLINKSPGTIDRMIRSVFKGNAYLREGPVEENNRIFAKFMRRAPDDQGVVAAVRYFRDAAPRSLALTPVLIETSLAILAEGDPTWAKEQPSRFVDPGFVNKVESGGFADKVYQEIGRIPDTTSKR